MSHEWREVHGKRILVKVCPSAAAKGSRPGEQHHRETHELKRKLKRDLREGMHLHEGIRKRDE